MLKNAAARTLCATEFLDCDTALVQDYAKRIIGSAQDPVEQARKLYYAMRDRILYDVYDIDLSRAGMRASSILSAGTGFCIHKSIAFTAAARSVGIPCRLAFADVRNHISTPRLREIVGGEVFHWHSYAEIYLNGRWIKATPVFNLKLCQLFGIAPLEFDGTSDAALQLYDKQSDQYLEFICHHGSFEEFPYAQCIAALKRHHPLLFTNGRRTIRGNLAKEQHSEAISPC